MTAFINGVDYMINSADNLVHTPDGITSLYDVETNINAQLALTLSTVHRTDRSRVSEAAYVTSIYEYYLYFIHCIYFFTS